MKPEDDDQIELKNPSFEKDGIIYYRYLATNERGEIEILHAPIGTVKEAEALKKIRGEG